MGVDAECRRCGQVVSQSSLHDGTHKCDDEEMMSDLRDRIDALEDGGGGRRLSALLETTAYASAALGFAIAGDVARFGQCMNAAVQSAPFDWDYERPLNTSTPQMAALAAKLLEEIGDRF